MWRIVNIIAVVAVSALALSGGPSPQSQDSFISGVIRSSDGMPAAGVSVVARRMLSRDKAAAVADAGSGTVQFAVTDREGRYRLDGLAPGRYTILAGPVDWPTYYPGVRTQQDAAIVAVAAAVAGELEFSLRPPPMPRLVIGRVSALSAMGGSIPKALFIEITAIDGPSASSSPVRPSNEARIGEVEADGSFTLGALVPGTYEASLCTREWVLGVCFDPPTRFVVEEVDVADLDLAAPPLLAGEVAMDDARDLPLPDSVAAAGGPRQSDLDLRLDVSPVVRSTDAMMMLSNPAGKFAFLFREGEYRVNLSGIPFGYDVKSFVSGSVDLLHEPLIIAGPGPVAPLRILLTREFAPAGVAVQGTIGGRADTSNPPWVYLFTRGMDDPRQRAATDRAAAVPVQSDGSFAFSGVRPGEYSARLVIPDSAARYPQVDVSVAGRDVILDMAPLVLAPVRGQVVVVDNEGRELPMPSDLALPEPGEDAPRPAQFSIVFSSPGFGANALILEDGAFGTFLRFGDYAISLNFALSERYLLRSISWGDVNLTQAPLRIDRLAPPAELRILLQRLSP